MTKSVFFDKAAPALLSVWSEARSAHSKFYDSGVPCRKNLTHGTVRYTNNRKCVECSREHSRTPESISRVKAAYAAMTHKEKMVSWAKYRHKYNSYPGNFDLTVGAIEWPEFCPALGMKLIYEAQRDRSTDNAPTLDRKNPKLGYTLDNVQVLSRKANRIKNDGTAEEIMRVALFVAAGERQ